MASDDGNSLLEIPGAWISTELDLDLSLPVSLTAPSSVRSAYIRSPLNEPPIPLPRCDTLPPPSAPIVGRSTPRAAYLALEPHESDLGVERATVVMSVGPDAAADVTPQVRGIQNVGRFFGQTLVFSFRTLRRCPTVHPTHLVHPFHPQLAYPHFLCPERRSQKTPPPSILASRSFLFAHPGPFSPDTTPIQAFQLPRRT